MRKGDWLKFRSNSNPNSDEDLQSFQYKSIGPDFPIWLQYAPPNPELAILAPNCEVSSVHIYDPFQVILLYQINLQEIQFIMEHGTIKPIRRYKRHDKKFYVIYLVTSNVSIL